MKIEPESLKSKYADIRAGARTSLITVTAWSNGEGYDVSITSGTRVFMFQLLHEEADALTAILSSFHVESA